MITFHITQFSDIQFCMHCIIYNLQFSKGKETTRYFYD